MAIDQFENLPGIIAELQDGGLIRDVFQETPPELASPLRLVILRHPIDAAGALTP